MGANRTAQEQHPFHMHGHHFWVLGYGLGVYNDSTNSSALNLHNPAFRDSFTIYKNGWTVIRFKVSDDCRVAEVHLQIDKGTMQFTCTQLEELVDFLLP